MAIYPAKYTVHKGKRGAFQLAPIPPTWTSEQGKDKEGRPVVNHKVTREGALMVEMAPFLEERDGNFYYNWKAKVGFALGVADICQILEKIGTKFNLVHAINGENKTMQFIPGEAQYEGTMNIFLSHTQPGGDAPMKASIAMSGGETQVFLSLLSYSIKGMLGWDEVSGLA